mmetsp:Transcript_144311/g.251581  ORF Transcript_144311/g.251581 Transcript_144311/m.251581 type:complete len:280 (+) Transcript_144311:55-894(+)
MKMMRAVILAALLTSCACGAPEVKAPKSTVAAKPAVTLKAAAAPKPVTAPKQVTTSKPVKATTPVKAAKPAVASKLAAVASKPAVTLKAAQAPKPVAAPKPVTAQKPATAAKPVTAAKVVNVVAKAAAAQPAVHAHVQVVASAPAGAPAAAPAGGPAGSDWRKEYAHTDDPEKLKWKWTTNKPGTYSIGTKAPRKLLPIGEGAYQSAEAVAQRTKDNSSDCESGKWNDCFLKHGGNLTDGHVYGNLKGKYGNAPQTKSEAAVTSFGLAALSLLLPSLVF